MQAKANLYPSPIRIAKYTRLMLKYFIKFDVFPSAANQDDQIPGQCKAPVAAHVAESMGRRQLRSIHGRGA